MTKFVYPNGVDPQALARWATTLVGQLDQNEIRRDNYVRELVTSILGAYTPTAGLGTMAYENAVDYLTAVATNAAITAALAPYATTASVTAAIAAALAPYALTADVTAAIAAAVATTLLKANNLSDLANVATARNNLGLGALAVLNSLGFSDLTGSLAIGQVPNDLITYAKLQNVAANNTLLGRISGAAGDVEELTASQVRTLLALVIGTNVQAWDADLDTLASTYAAGTWTPVLALATPGTSSFSYSSQVGTYLRIGARVFATFALAFTPTIGTGSGRLDGSGLPFTAADANGGGPVINLNAQWTWPAGVTDPNLFMNSTTTFSIGGLGSAIARTGFGATNMTSGNAHTFVGSLTYRV